MHRLEVFFLMVGVALLCGASYAQAPTSLQPKDSPASSALSAASTQYASDSKALDEKSQQAQASFDNDRKNLVDSLTAKSKALQDDVKADKKYTKRIEEIETIQKQLNDLQNNALSKFKTAAGDLNSKVLQEQNEMGALIKVVREENHFPPTATFDMKTGKWTDSKPIAKEEKK